MGKTLYKTVYISMATLLLLSSVVGCSSSTVEESVNVDEKILYKTEDIKKGQELVAENENLALYIDTKTTEIAVKNKKNNQMWYSNPQDLENDALASGINKSKLQSQLTIYYNNPKGDVIEMNNYDYSISLGQFEIEQIENGVKVYYTLGKAIPEYCLPEVIKAENFQELILDKLENPDEKRVIEKAYKKIDLAEIKDVKQKEEYLSKYPILETQVLYELRGNQQDFRLEQFSQMLLNVGYGMEEARQEEIDNGYNEHKENITFNIAITYQLDEEGFITSVDTQDIEYNSKYPIVDIKVLEFFGAAGAKEEGYILVPDAAGALIHFNNGKKQAQSYKGKVYGTDYAMQSKEKIENTSQIYMPVFGMKYENGAFIGIIEKGQAIATIEADIGGKVHGYNNVCTNFNVLPNEQIKLPSLAAMNIIKAYQTKFVADGLQVRYKFLDKQEANYTSMASAYREYLLEEGMLEKKVIEETPLVVEVLGAIEVDKNFIGVPYKGMQALTSYEQTIGIMQQLIDEGISNISVKYTGLANGGIEHSLPNKLDLESSLGGKKGFEKLIDFSKSSYIDIYPEFDIQYARKNLLFDDFLSVKNGVRRLDKQMAKKIEFSHVTYQADKRKEQIPLVTYDYMSKLTSNLIDNLENKGLEAVSISNIGKDLSSDFNDKNTIDREQAKDRINEELEKINSSEIKVMTSGANSYVLPYVDLITDMPLTSNNYNIIDKEIPFMQIVLHGYIPYTSESINLAQDYEHTLLKIIETGSGLKYTWIGEDNYLLKDTDYSHYYSTSYKEWIDEATSFYNQINNDLGDTYNQMMVRHEEIQEGVYEVEYEKGKTVLVNYNEYDVTVDGQVIEEMNYGVIGGKR